MDAQDACSTWENQLIERAILGDEGAFSALSDIYRPILTSMANRLLKNSDDASDVVQETLYKAFRSIGDFKVGRPLKPWLYRICSNCCIDSVRQKRRETTNLEDQEDIPESGIQVDEEVGGNLIRNQLIEAIGRLPARYRIIILMRHFRQMEVSEIATELKTPEGTVKSWLFRARALLKKDLRPAFY
jgi:RNA polymerase sigma-70 factor (ECF subfamily)